MTIVGAGIAGAAAAFFLSQLHGVTVRILEKEPRAGFHATGRNAAMVRRLVAPSSLAQLAAEGAQFIESWAASVGGDALMRTGGLIAGDEGALNDLVVASDLLGSYRALPITEIGSHIPAWRPTSDNHGGILVPDDGVVDVALLLEDLLRGARKNGAELLLSTCLEDVMVADERVHSVQTNKGELATDVLINAAGPWAGELSAMAGATAIPMTPRKRHLHWTGPLSGSPSDVPYFWDITNNFYFRPESDGLLLCACDEEIEPPNDAQPSANALEFLSDRLEEHAPYLADLPIARTWAGLRTFAPDNQFVIGWDPTLTGFYWIAGLGGHGVTTCAAVGRLAAKQVAMGQSAALDTSTPFSPDRLV